MANSDIIADRYYITAQIGHGGFSSVFLAYDKISEKSYALKVLNCDVSDEKKEKTFKQEAMTLANINHPNVLHIHDFGTFYDEEDGITKAYLATEYIRGKSLRNTIDEKGVLLVDEFLLYMYQIIDGLEVCHNRNIYHRDIKPQNFVMTSTGKVILIDFGTALIGDEYQKENLIMDDKDNFRGTIQYVAPEHFKNPIGSKQTDIYALGITMFEMFTGKLPFTSEKKDRKEFQREIVHHQLHTPLPSVRSINPNVPEAFDKIIKKCCEKKTADRYKDVREIRLDLIKAENEYKNPSQKKKGFFARLFKKS